MSSTEAALKFTDKQDAFARAFALKGDLVEAARQAGYSKSACRRPGEILNSAAVQQQVVYWRERFASLIDIREVAVLREVGRLAMSRITDAVDLRIDDEGNVTLKPREFSELSDDVKAAIKKVVVRNTRYGTDVTLEMHDKSKALDLLASLKNMRENTKPPPPIIYNTQINTDVAQVKIGE